MTSLIISLTIGVFLGILLGALTIAVCRRYTRQVYWYRVFPPGARAEMHAEIVQRDAVRVIVVNDDQAPTLPLVPQEQAEWDG